MMRVKYIVESFGVDSLTNGKIYECLGPEDIEEKDSWLRIVDDSEEDYLYSAVQPGPFTIPDDGHYPCGRWEIVEDDENGTLTKLFQKYKLI